jgi:hypothetical protein
MAYAGYTFMWIAATVAYYRRGRRVGVRAALAALLAASQRRASATRRGARRSQSGGSTRAQRDGEVEHVRRDVREHPVDVPA